MIYLYHSTLPQGLQVLTATLRKWGGSIALPIPPAILNALGLQSGAEVTLRVANGRLLIEPARKYSFKSLLAEHTTLELQPDNDWRDFPELASEQTKP